MVEKLVPVVQGGARGLQHHQALLCEAESALARGRAEGGGLGLEGPGDVVILLLLHPLVLQGPDVFAQASGATLAGLLEVLLMVAMPQLPLRLYIYIYSDIVI